MEQCVAMADAQGQGAIDPPVGLASYRAGVRSIERFAPMAGWDAPTPCGEWRTVELIGHLLAIVRYCHRLLDAASMGQPLEGLPQGLQLAAMNAEELAVLAEVRGDVRAREFVAEADAYAVRLHSTDWSMILGVWSSAGSLSVGQHTGLVLGEWHVHAWDLARSAGLDYQPDDAGTVAEGQRTLDHTPGFADPWIDVLSTYGRDPNWSRPTGESV